MLRRVDGDDLADDIGVQQPETERAAGPWLEGGLVEPAREAFGRGHEVEDDLARGVDLGLQLDPGVHADTIPRERTRAVRSWTIGIRSGMATVSHFRLTYLFEVPLVRRVAWHLSRVRRSLDRRFFIALGTGLFVVVLVAALAITVLEKPWTFESLGDSMYWSITTIFGQGDATYATSPGGWLVSWLLILFGVAILGTITGAFVALVIDFLLKEGQGMGASGFRDHIVICGWNATARDLVDELQTDDYRAKLVLVHRADRSPAGSGVYFVNGDPTDLADLERAGIEDAQAALIFPASPTDDADMRSILTIMAIESVAPHVRTVAEVNNPRHVEHFRRARVDEVLVTSSLASRLLARSALYPGLTGLVTDIVSGGEGSELYRVTCPRRMSACRSTRPAPGCAPSIERPCWLSAGAARRSSTRPPTSTSRPATRHSSWPSRWAPWRR